MRAKGDPGVGFYRFRASDAPTLTKRYQSTGATVEVFAENLDKARRMVALLSRGLVRPIGGASGDAIEVVAPEIWPFQHRPTRLCKRARAARGET